MIITYAVARRDLPSPPNEEGNMHPILRAALTTLCVIALTWPLLFWGKPASPNYMNRYPGTGQPPVYNDMVRPDLLW
jgi:hypothetical protein